MIIKPPSWATRTFTQTPPPPSPQPVKMPAARYITTPSDVTLSELAWMYYRNVRDWARIYNANDVITDPNAVIPAGTTLEIP